MIVVNTHEIEGATVAPNGWRTYSFDGAGVRVDGAGRAGRPLARFLGYHYPDGDSSMIFPARPKCCDLEPFFRVARDVPSLEGLNVAAMSFGQFSLSHDVALTPDSSDPNPSPEACTSMFRMAYAPGSSPRDHLNVVSPLLDLSQVYGADDARSLALRTLSNGLLKTGPGNLPPRNCVQLGIDMSNPVHGVTNDQLFCLGDVRGNENVMLLTLHVVFLREHNRLARTLKDEHPTWSDDELFFKARAMNIAAYQQIVFYEYSRAILGTQSFDTQLGEYSGHDPAVKPIVSAEFAQAAFRFTHGQIPEVVLEMVTPSFPKERSLSEFFFAPGELSARGVDSFLHGMLLYPSQEVDAAYAASVLDFPHLAALDCLRVRDLGLASFEYARAHYGISSIPTAVPRKKVLLDAYAGFDTDLWAGGMAEDHLPGASFGPVFVAIYAQQLHVLRAGDPFWFENPTYEMLSEEERETAKGTTLADVLRRNTGVPGELIPDQALKMPHYSPNTATTGGVGPPPPPPFPSTAAVGSEFVQSSLGSKNDVKYLRAITGLVATNLTLLFSIVALATFALIYYRKKPLATRSLLGGERKVRAGRDLGRNFSGVLQDCLSASTSDAAKELELSSSEYSQTTSGSQAQEAERLPGNDPMLTKQ